ncbi:MAG TPA: hypothetical protein QGF83_16450 [Sulfitobacter pontiacus]|uniref:hypothetical protein n=1 Tax=Sulfitobacter pontiacus TaxID=60137 RepID=UPI002AC2EB53|nr:hypothetical protein [Sulfitobacter pontiacus]
MAQQFVRQISVRLGSHDLGVERFAQLGLVVDLELDQITGVETAYRLVHCRGVTLEIRKVAVILAPEHSFVGSGIAPKYHTVHLTVPSRCLQT